ncbi:KOW motif domain-containing protein [Dehalococcoides sp.]|uniref:KOW motif domain-containing protein n=1 Tax=Dehalococcoides sp. TaxID=1966486 RepID=UPI003561DA5C
MTFWKPLIDTPFARFVVKYNTTEKYQKYTAFATGGTSTYFTVSFGIGNFEVGDEVTVVAGSGAGQIRHVQSIDTALNRVYVDETLYNSENGNEYNNTSYLLVTPFKKAGVIKGSDNKGAVNKLLRFNARAKKIQIKVEVWSPSGFTGEWDMGLRDMTTIYIPDRTIK